MPRPPLTDRQHRLLVYIAGFANEHGYPPTMREMMTMFAWASTNAPNDHVRALVRKGYLRRVPGRSRGITVVRPVPLHSSEGQA